VPTKADYSRNNPNETITNLASEVPFIIGGSDGCLANLGSFVFKENEAAVTIGTSGAVRISSSKPTHDYEAMTFNYRLDSDTFISGGPINNGGIVLQWFLKNILKKANLTPTDYEELFEDISKVEAGANGVVFLPYLHGERAPIWDTKSCGTFFGVKAYHTTAHFSKAIIEGICYALNNVLETLDGSGDKITRLHVSGGFVTSKIWLQILADITGKRVCVINTEDASAIGAAYFALKTSGAVEDYDTLFANRNIEFIEPSTTNHSIYRNYFIIYKNLYQTLKDQMHLLYNLNHS
jgi:gluconokinase